MVANVSCHDGKSKHRTGGVIQSGINSYGFLLNILIKLDNTSYYQHTKNLCVLIISAMNAMGPLECAT
jgi:hypothetical protein